MSAPLDDEDAERLAKDIAGVMRNSEFDCRTWSEETRMELAREIVDALESLGVPF